MDLAKGVLGAMYRLVIGESPARRAIAYALLPNGPMMWDIMSASLLVSPPRPVGYPPGFCDPEAVRRPFEIDVLKNCGYPGK